MLKAVEATIGTDGQIRLLEPLRLGRSCRAIVTILEDADVSESALLSQRALAQDWERLEEDAAWSHLH